jgi:molybdenum cofactor cytidylyltransferase
MTNVALLIPAAGFSGRMRGTDKLMQPVAGEPLLRRQARIALATGAEVIVTLPAIPGPRNDALAGLPVTLLPIPDTAEGMAASLRRGIAALPATATGVLILLADLPEIDTQDLTAMITAFEADPARILRAQTAAGQPGHPVLFPRTTFADFAGLHGDAGAKAVIMAHKDLLTPFTLAGEKAITDLDTPEDWAAWRAKAGL